MRHGASAVAVAVVLGELLLDPVHDDVDAGLLHAVQRNVIGRMVDAHRPVEVLLVHT